MSNQTKKFVDLLKEANHQNDVLLERLKEACDMRDKWESGYYKLYKEHCRLRNQLLCKSCEEDKRLTQEGKTFVLCEKCADIITDWKKEVQSLEEKAKYWEACYRDLLEHGVIVK